MSLKVAGSTQQVMTGLQDSFEEPMMLSTPHHQSKRLRTLEASNSEVFIPSDLQRLQQMFPLLDNRVSPSTFSPSSSNCKRSLISATTIAPRPTRSSWPTSGRLRGQLV